MKNHFTFFLILVLWTTMYAQDYRTDTLTHPDGKFIATDLNNRGQISGYVQGVGTHALRREPNGTFTQLEELDLKLSTAAKMNERGDIVGLNWGLDGKHLVVWLNDGGMRELEYPPGATGVDPRDINNQCEVVGSYHFEDFIARAAFWDSMGIFHELPQSASGGTPSAINDSTHIAGTTIDSMGVGHATVWKPVDKSTRSNTFTFEPFIINEGHQGGAHAIDKYSNVGGWTQYFSGAHAIYYNNSQKKIIDLDPTGKIFSTVWAMNNWNVPGGVAQDSTDKDRVGYWIPDNPENPGNFEFVVRDDLLRVPSKDEYSQIIAMNDARQAIWIVGDYFYLDKPNFSAYLSSSAVSGTGEFGEPNSPFESIAEFFENSFALNNIDRAFELYLENNSHIDTDIYPFGNLPEYSLGTYSFGLKKELLYNPPGSASFNNFTVKPNVKFNLKGNFSITGDFSNEGFINLNTYGLNFETREGGNYEIKGNGQFGGDPTTSKIVIGGTGAASIRLSGNPDSDYDFPNTEINLNNQNNTLIIDVEASEAEARSLTFNGFDVLGGKVNIITDKMTVNEDVNLRGGIWNAISPGENRFQEINILGDHYQSGSAEFYLNGNSYSTSNFFLGENMGLYAGSGLVDLGGGNLSVENTFRVGTNLLDNLQNRFYLGDGTLSVGGNFSFSGTPDFSGEAIPLDDLGFQGKIVVNGIVPQEIFVAPDQGIYLDDLVVSNEQGISLLSDIIHNGDGQLIFENGTVHTGDSEYILQTTDSVSESLLQIEGIIGAGPNRALQGSISRILSQNHAPFELATHPLIDPDQEKYVELAIQSPNSPIGQYISTSRIDSIQNSPILSWIPPLTTVFDETRQLKLDRLRTLPITLTIQTINDFPPRSKTLQLPDVNVRLRFNGISDHEDPSMFRILQFDCEGKLIGIPGTFEPALAGDPTSAMISGFAADTTLMISQKGVSLEPCNIFVIASGEISTATEDLSVDKTFTRIFPNPFDDLTYVEFELDRPAQVRLSILDVLGREVRTITNNFFNPGKHQLPWYGDSDQGHQLAEGIYFSRLNIVSQVSNPGHPGIIYIGKMLKLD